MKGLIDGQYSNFNGLIKIQNRQKIIFDNPAESNRREWVKQNFCR
jgi:hypothetical protein